jgi:creatinine amidohydrolase
MNQMTWPQVAVMDRKKTCCLLPVSSFEQHGGHLPLGTDDFILQGILDALREDQRIIAPILLLPTISYNNSHEHLAFSGVVSLRNATLVAIVEDILDSMRRHKLARLVVLNSHDGNTALLDAYAQEWELEYGVRFFNISLWAPDFFSGAQNLIDSAIDNEIHAGEIETSLLLYTMPDVVQTERITAKDDRLVKLKTYHSGWNSAELSPGNGVMGSPSLATAEKGKKLLRYAVDKVTTYLNELLRLG